MNPPNERAQATKEAGEGSPRTKENIAESSTPPAQNGRGVSQGLSGVRRVARERKQERFTSLLLEDRLKDLHSRIQRGR